MKKRTGIPIIYRYLSEAYLVYHEGSCQFAPSWLQNPLTAADARPMLVPRSLPSVAIGTARHRTGKKISDRFTLSSAKCQPSPDHESPEACLQQ
jgi:hypothetical protein